MLHTFQEFISLSYGNYQTIRAFSESYYKIIAKKFFNAKTFRELLQNNTTNFFRVHINQLLKLPNKTDFFGELVPNNSKHFFQSSYQIILTLSENQYQKIQHTVYQTKLCINKNLYQTIDFTTKYYSVWFNKYFQEEDIKSSFFQ